eukprot:g9586.t1
MSAPLPTSWSEEKDPKGRIYYSNHRTRETTWERPVAGAAAVTEDLPPPYGSSAGAAPAPQLKPSGPCCTPRLTFWITVGLGWIVWVLAVVAAADDDWIEDIELAAGDEDLLDDCEDNDGDFCQRYKAFTAMQFIAVLLCSIAMVVFMITFFRPARGGCLSAKTVGMIGGGLMIGFAFCQMLAFVIMIVLEKDFDNDGFEARLSGTFAVAVIACVLGIVHAATILVFARSAGDGVLYKCCHECMAMNNASNAPNQQQPAPPTATTTVPPPAPVAPPEPASTAV